MALPVMLLLTLALSSIETPEPVAGPPFPVIVLFTIWLPELAAPAWIWMPELPLNAMTLDWIVLLPVESVRAPVEVAPAARLPAGSRPAQPPVPCWMPRPLLPSDVLASFATPT